MAETARASTTTTTTTRPQMAIETRARLVSLAREMFGSKGYAATSLDELTIFARLTRGALYHHFKSKLGLFEAVVDEIEDELDRTIEEAGRKAGSGWARFRAGSRAYFTQLQRPALRRILLDDAPAAIPDFHDRPRNRLCARAMVEDLAAAMEDGHIRHTDPEALANIISGAVITAAAWASSQKDAVSALIAAQNVIDRLLDGLEPGSNS